VASVPPKGGRKHPQQEFLQVDTSNILFIVAGAFVGLEKIIDQRQNKKPSVGLGQQKADKEAETAIEKLGGIEAGDLSRFGLIPEFIGRLPVNAMLQELSEDDLMHILTQPKNAIVKQYQKLFEFDGIELEITDDALREVAKTAIKKKTGARGLRSILEQTMLDVMYEIPANDKICKCIVTKEAIQGVESPQLVEGERKITPSSKGNLESSKNIENAS
jgi:ATP-dependent Clp protease ATP-binding subunit ClpX